MGAKTFYLSLEFLKNESHTGENIKNILLNFIEKWGLKDRINFISTDNASNMKKAAELLSNHGIEHFGCFSHYLNLIVQNTLKTMNMGKVNGIIEKIRKIVIQIKNSVLLTKKLKDNISNLKIQQKKLILDVSTRWNSIYYMLSRYLELENALKFTIHVSLNDFDIMVINKLVPLLKFFEKLTNLASLEENSLSLIIPSISAINNLLKTKLDQMKIMQSNKEVEDGDPNELETTKDLIY